jgi:hypothetical protein
MPWISAVNGWEFSRNPLENNSYGHPLFLRDDPERCLDMVRFGATKNAAGVFIKSKAKGKQKREPKAAAPTDDDDDDDDDQEEPGK